MSEGVKLRVGIAGADTSPNAHPHLILTGGDPIFACPDCFMLQRLPEESVKGLKRDDDRVTGKATLATPIICRKASCGAVWRVKDGIVRKVE